MNFAKSIRRLSAFGALAGVLIPLKGAISIYTSEAAFLLAVAETGVDGFDGFDVSAPTSGPITRNAGDFSYSAAVDNSSLFYGAGSVENPWLSTNYAYEMITFSNFSSGVVGFGGNFFGSTIEGSFQPGDVRLTATDAEGTATYFLENATVTGFLAFVATTPLLSVSLTAHQSGMNVWPTADNVTLALPRPPPPPAPTPTPVPEPATYALIVSALALGATMTARRRRTKI